MLKAHPRNEKGKNIIRHINETISKTEFSNWIVFLPNYDLESAKYLVAGSDVWLNTPIRGKEASGTSGMKSSANGVLQCSVCDGWFDEVRDFGLGWNLDDKDTARSIYTTLEREVLTLFYNRGTDGVPEDWVNRMKKTMAKIMEDYSASRMLKDYFQKLYIPAFEQFKGNYHRTKRIRENPNKV